MHQLQIKIDINHADVIGIIMNTKKIAHLIKTEMEVEEKRARRQGIVTTKGERKDIDLDTMKMKRAKVKKAIDSIDAENTGRNNKKKAKMCKLTILKKIERDLTAAIDTTSTSATTLVSLHPIKGALL